MISVTAVNDAPTLTAFSGPVDTTLEDTEVEVTFAELTAQGDEADIDGTVAAFVVKSVVSGALRIGTTAGTATAWAAGTNDTIDGSTHAYWTPASHANGTLNAFTVVAEDNQGLESVGNIAAQLSVTAVNDAPAGLPTITGTATEDQILTADTSGISDNDGLGAFSYQWLRDGVAIGGATSSTYTLGDIDVNTQISVQVSYTDGDGTAEGPLTSSQTAFVANINDVPSGLPTITGTPTEDQTLTADTSGISDDDGLGAFSYQWLRDGVAIGGAAGGHHGDQAHRGPERRGS